jgi:hypothetical protein
VPAGEANPSRIDVLFGNMQVSRRLPPAGAWGRSRPCFQRDPPPASLEPYQRGHRPSEPHLSEAQRGAHGGSLHQLRRSALAAGKDFRYFPIRMQKPTSHRSSMVQLLGNRNHTAYWAAAAGTAENPIFSLCCHGGQLLLQPREPPPPALLRLVMGEDPDSKHFLQHIRRYNMRFMLASTKAKVDYAHAAGAGIQTLGINGTCLHRWGPLEPAPDRHGIVHEHAFAQIYIMDDAVRPHPP